MGFPTLSTLPAPQRIARTIIYWWWLLSILLKYLNIFINSVKINAYVCHSYQKKGRAFQTLHASRFMRNRKELWLKWDMHAYNAYPPSFCFPAQGRRNYFWGESTNMEDSDRVIIRMMVVSRDPQQLIMGSEQQSRSSYSSYYQRFITGRAEVCHLWAEKSANRCNLGSSSMNVLDFIWRPTGAVCAKK